MKSPAITAVKHHPDIKDKFLSAPGIKPVIIAASGLPGTGKTHFCRRLAERLPCNIIESDVLRKQLFRNPSYSAKESNELFGVIYTILKDLLKRGKSVILDATNLTEKSRERLYRTAERAKARFILVEITAPPELVRERLRQRPIAKGNNSDADWAVYQRMQSTVEKISRQHYTVDTSRDITPEIDKIVQEAERREETKNGY